MEGWARKLNTRIGLSDSIREEKKDAHDAAAMVSDPESAPESAPTASVDIPSVDKVDHMLSKELLQLSMRDRNAISDEIHGVATLAPDENPEFLRASLEELSKELEQIPDDCPTKAAYLESQKLPKTYVNTEDFRLRFLRYEFFDAKLAAVRLIKFLDFASELVGPALLERPIRVSDLSKDDQRLMRAGNIQVLPFRDRSGRPILAWVADFGFAQGTAKSRHKLSLYLSYSMSDDVETQRKGIIFLCWAAAHKFDKMPPFPQKEDTEYQTRFSEGIPLRRCCTHFCLPDKPFFHVLRSMFAMSYGSQRSRLRFHVGEEIELLYELKTYGIPIELIPLTKGGKIKTASFKQWLRARKQIDESRAKNGEEDSIIDCPRSPDVIFRNGVSLMCHPGNSMFQGLIQSRIQEHSIASQAEKMAITKEIIDTVVQNQGRFLHWDESGWWTPLRGASTIHTKVAASVKTFKGKKVALIQKQQQQLRQLQQEPPKRRQVPQSKAFLFQNLDGKRRKLFHEKEGCCGPCFFDDQGRQYEVRW